MHSRCSSDLDSWIRLDLTITEFGDADRVPPPRGRARDIRRGTGGRPTSAGGSGRPRSASCSVGSRGRGRAGGATDRAGCRPRCRSCRPAPRREVMGLGPRGRDVAAVRPALPVAHRHRDALRLVEESPGAAEVQRLALAVQHKGHDRGVAGEPHRLAAEIRSPVLSPAAPTWARSAAKSTVTTTEVDAPPCSGSRWPGIASSSEQNAWPSSTAYGSRCPVSGSTRSESGPRWPRRGEAYASR